MPRRPVKKMASQPEVPKGELFSSGEIESVVPELAALQAKTAIQGVTGAVQASAASGALETRPYVHPTATTPLRPEIGTQDRFRKKKGPATYRHDPSLAPELCWDGQNPAREPAEALIRRIQEAKTLEEAQAAAAELARLSRPFLNWAGKAERLSFDVPTLPLFIHERLSTQAILETLKGHRRAEGEQLNWVDNFFGDPRHTELDQITRAYEYPDRWVNRLILGDALVVMNSLARYEGLGGQVQMIYVDPPYGVKFGSNFQPFVRERGVSNGDDDAFTREPEMVQAYRDTWELGLHSYLSYLRDRLLLSRELLAPTGSIFVQISDDNLHHVREVMDEVFGAENFVSVVTVKKTTSATSELLPSVCDYLLWYSRDRSRLKFRQTYLRKNLGGVGGGQYNYVELPDKTRRQIRSDESIDEALQSGVLFCHDNITSQRPPGSFPVELNGKTYSPGKGFWKTGEAGMQKLREARRLMAVGNTLRYVRYFNDFPVYPVSNLWDDTVTSGFSDPKLYVVQTNTKIIERAMLMTTDPGDLVLDWTCGSGTTAYVAEQWGRRWITVDVSRVPLALARQRLLTASFPWYQLKDESRGPADGFVYKRRQNKKGEEVGGIVPHVTLKSIANGEPAAEEVLVDRPEEARGIVRVCGPFTVEATIPTPVDWEGDGEEDAKAQPAEDYQNFVARMIEVLRKSPVLRLDGGRTVQLKAVRAPAKSLSLNAEAMQLNGTDKPVAFVFGPETGAVSTKLVSAAAREAYQKSYAHLYVIGFAIQPDARKFVDQCETVGGIAATYVQATPDLIMGDLLKNLRSSHIFSVCGLPEIAAKRLSLAKAKEGERWQVELLGLDVFDPATMTPSHRAGNDVPAWFLDTDYNGLVFRVRQAFFPRTCAWDNLKKELRAEFEDGVWEHLAGAVSAPFEPGEQRAVAVKVIDDRGNELLVVKELK